MGKSHVEHAFLIAEAEFEAFGNHVMAFFGAREDDVAMITLRRSAL